MRSACDAANAASRGGAYIAARRGGALAAAVRGGHTAVALLLFERTSTAVDVWANDYDLLRVALASLPPRAHPERHAKLELARALLDVGMQVCDPVVYDNYHTRDMVYSEFAKVLGILVDHGVAADEVPKYCLEALKGATVTGCTRYNTSEYHREILAGLTAIGMSIDILRALRRAGSAEYLFRENTHAARTYVFGLGLSADDARAMDGEFMIRACLWANYVAVRALLALGLTATDVGAQEYRALKNALYTGSSVSERARIVCALVAVEGVEPPGAMRVRVVSSLAANVPEPAVEEMIAKWGGTAETDLATWAAERRAAAARVAAWPDIDRLVAELSAEDRAGWAELADQVMMESKPRDM